MRKAYVCGCERGGDCTKTTVCAIDSALEESEDYIAGLESQLSDQCIETGATEYHLRKQVDELKSEIKQYQSGYKGACYACEPVGELNLKLEAALTQIAGYDGMAKRDRHACAQIARSALDA